MRLPILEKLSDVYRSLVADEEDLEVDREIHHEDELDDKKEFHDEINFYDSEDYTLEEFLEDLDCFAPLERQEIQEIHDIEELKYSIVHFRETNEDNIYFGSPCGSASYKFETETDLDNTFYLVEEDGWELSYGLKGAEIIKPVDYLVQDNLIEEIDDH